MCLHLRLPLEKLFYGINEQKTTRSGGARILGAYASIQPEESAYCLRAYYRGSEVLLFFNHQLQCFILIGSIDHYKVNAFQQIFGGHFMHACANIFLF